VNLKERSVSQGISYAAARRWHDAGTMPAAACQAGRLIVTGDPAPAGRAGVAAVHAPGLLRWPGRRPGPPGGAGHRMGSGGRPPRRPGRACRLPRHLRPLVRARTM